MNLRLQPSRMDHRWGTRTLVSRPVLLRAASRKEARGRLTAVSLSGGWIETSEHFPMLSSVRVVFDSRTFSSLAPEALAGQVIRHSDSGVAVEWLELAPEVIAEMVATSHQFDPAAPFERALESVC